MKRLVLVLALLIPAVLPAQEIVTLATPITKTATVCAIDTVILDVARSRIVAALVCPGGDPITKQYDSFSTPTGAFLLGQLNRGNFTVNSLISAVYTRLKTDGVITGTVSGTPQD